MHHSLDIYRRWKQWFYPSESVLTPTHFEGSFYTPPGGMDRLQIFQRTQITDHWNPRIIVRSRKVLHVLTHQLFLKKAYHTYLWIDATGPTNSARRLRCPRHNLLPTLLTEIDPHGSVQTIRNSVLLMLFDADSLLSVLSASFHTSVSVLYCSASFFKIPLSIRAQ